MHDDEQDHVVGRPRRAGVCAAQSGNKRVSLIEARSSPCMAFSPCLPAATSAKQPHFENSLHDYALASNALDKSGVRVGRKVVVVLTMRSLFPQLASTLFAERAGEPMEEEYISRAGRLQCQLRSLEDG